MVVFRICLIGIHLVDRSDFYDCKLNIKRGFGICFMPSAEERRRQPNASTRVVEDDVVGARPSTNLELLF